MTYEEFKNARALVKTFTHVEKGCEYYVDYVSPKGLSEKNGRLDNFKWVKRKRRVFYRRVSDGKTFDRSLERFLERFKPTV